MAEKALLNRTSGPYRLQIREVNTDVVKDLEAALFIDQWPHDIQVPLDLSGRYQVTAYLDANNDGTLNDCPFPPAILDTEAADDFDNIQGEATFSFPIQRQPKITLHRHICGPGQIETGLQGRMEGLSDIESVSIKALIEKVPEPQVTDELPLRVSLLPYPMEDPTTFGFSIGELLPGNYSITIFMDNDEDNSPTPCSSRGGGADRGLASASNVVVQDGQRVIIEEPFVFTDLECPDELTGFTGEIRLGPTVNPLTASANALTNEVNGELWIQLVRSDGSETPTQLKILPTIKGRPNPLRYTVTGLEPGLWNITAFLDRDDSNDFSPCNVVSGGLDVITGRLESIRVREKAITDVDTVDLNALECGDESLSGIRGEITVERESGPLGSGRPILMRIYGEEEQIQQTLFLFENHSRVSGNFDRFVQKLSPGSYTADIFVDTNSNGVYEPCTEDIYGDRYRSERIPIELTAGSLLDLGRIDLSPRNECSSAEQNINLALTIDPEVVPERPNALNIWVRESGGWGMTSSIESWTEMENEWIVQYGRLPPGRYTFSVYSDDDGNGSLTTCNVENPDRYFAEFELSLRADSPFITPVVPLEAQCD